MKFIAWSIVIFGWIIYGLIIIAPFFDPHPHDPMQDFYILFHPKPGDWIAIPFIILALIGWYAAWDGVLWLAVMVLFVWLALTYMPGARQTLHQFIQNIPAVWHDFRRSVDSMLH